MKIDVEDIFIVGENSHGYRFCVGKVDGRWVGLAFAFNGMNVLRQIGDGPYLGVPDKDKAIRMAGAIAQSVEDGYGGMETWYVPVELQGKPDDFRCDNCDGVMCDGSCRDTDDYSMGELTNESA